MSRSTALVAAGSFAVGELLIAGAAGNDPNPVVPASDEGSDGPVGGLALTLFGNGSGVGKFGIVGRGTGVTGGATKVGVGKAGSGAGIVAGGAAGGAGVGAGFEAGTMAGAGAGVAAGA